MYRIRFHGRGGQGIKTAGHVLGTAFFDAGFQVQDAPLYGAERRGAPIFSYVRAAREPIHERGLIRAPDLVAVADETLVPVTAAGVLSGVSERTVLLIASHETPETWRERLRIPGPILTLRPPAIEDQAGRAMLGASCAGAAARLVGVISREALARAVEKEIGPLGPEAVAANLARALAAFDAMAAHEGCVAEGAGEAAGLEPPRWVDLGLAEAAAAAPAIFAGATSVEVRTGLWRIMRPVIEHDRCRRCVWICGTFCPDNAIAADAQGRPQVDYDHCKGCMICVAVCPHHAIAAIPETAAQAARGAEAAPSAAGRAAS